MTVKEGQLILVSGLSGAGKSTLIRTALQDMPDMSYLRTFTTRPKRDDENNSLEYQFVTDEQYEKLRAASAKWDHTDYCGYKYGADVDEALRAMRSGKHVICAVAPDLLVVQVMEKLYQTKPLTIWLDTPVRTARQRIAGDALRAARQEDEFAKDKFQHLFQPEGILAKDRAAFVRLLSYALD